MDINTLYSPSKWSKRLNSAEIVSSHIKVVTDSSHEAMETISCRLNISYGTTKNQKLSIFGEEETAHDAPIVVYIHGGYWQLLGHQQSAFMASAMVANGALLIAIGYDLAPSVTMQQIVSQVEQAIDYCMEFAQKRGSRCVWLCGHSAGAHLAAVVATSSRLPSWHLLDGLFLVSGIYDLQPLIHTQENVNLKLDDVLAYNVSPMNLIATLKQQAKHLTIAVVVAEFDSPAFREQSYAYHKAIESAGLTALLIDVSHKDHFDVIEDMRFKHDDQTQLLFKLIKKADI